MPTHEQFLELCEAGARIFSRCSRRSYYAIVVSGSGRVLGTGYNGTPSGLTNCTDGGCPRASSTVAHGSGYSSGAGTCYAVHAEGNALLHSDRSAREGGTLYVNGPPCMGCAVLICGSGIKTLVCKEDKAYAEWPQCKQLLESVGIDVHVLSSTADIQRPDPCGPVGFGTETVVDLAAGIAERGSVAGSPTDRSALGISPSNCWNDGSNRLPYEE